MTVEGAWRPQYGTRWAGAGRDGLDLVKVGELTFLTSLEQVRALRVHGRVQDDSAVFGCEELEFLELYTGARNPLRCAALKRLEVLSVDARPGLETIQGLERLRELALYTYAGDDLAFLAGLPGLWGLALAEQGAPLRSLAGVQQTPALRRVNLQVGAGLELSPLAGLAELQEVILISPAPLPAGNRLDLEPLAACPDLREVQLHGLGTVAGLESLRGLERLRRVLLSDTVPEHVSGDLPFQVMVL